ARGALQAIAEAQQLAHARRLLGPGPGPPGPPFHPARADPRLHGHWVGPALAGRAVVGNALTRCAPAASALVAFDRLVDQTGGAGVLLGRLARDGAFGGLRRDARGALLARASFERGARGRIRRPLAGRGGGAVLGRGAPGGAVAAINCGQGAFEL